MSAHGSAFGHTVSMRVAAGMVASRAEVMLVPRRRLQTQLIRRQLAADPLMTTPGSSVRPVPPNNAPVGAHCMSLSPSPRPVVYLTADDDGNGRDENTVLTWRRRPVVGGGGGKLEEENVPRCCSEVRMWCEYEGGFDSESRKGSRWPMYREHLQRTRPSPDETASTSSMRNIDSDCIPVTYCSMILRTPPYILHNESRWRSSRIFGAYTSLSFDVCAAQTALSAADDSSVNASIVLIYNLIITTYTPALYTDAALSQTAPSLDPTTMHCVPNLYPRHRRYRLDSQPGPTRHHRRR
ncbi:hypothetical protein M422DRAFT_242786 [Sphaerobolus stellatus SS14]|nr:hypothetical protein M422DRAFT_242786 [Sphaerobolus stellatus SS14]